MDTRQGHHEQVKAKLRMRLAELLQHAPEGPASVSRTKALKEQLRITLKTLPTKDYRLLQISRSSEEDQFLQDILDESLQSDLLAKLLADASISEIMINGPHEIFIERQGRLERMDGGFQDEHQLMLVLERLLDSLGLSVTESNPTCDAMLPDGSRMNVAIKPIVMNGPIVTIRRKLPHWTMDQFIELGALTGQAAEFLAACVKARVNMILSGGTSTGKTTLVAVLSAYIPLEQRIITIESVPELELTGRRHWIRLVAKQPNIEGRGEISLRTLVKNALRMRPDRIVLGEARGGEALDVVQAMHVGHDGFFTVLHASNPEAALERLQILMLMSGLDLPPAVCRMQIASAVDLIVHINRFADGSRRVSSISQVLGVSQQGFELEELFAFQMDGFSDQGLLRGECRYTGARPKFLPKFRLNNVEVPSWLKG